MNTLIFLGGAGLGSLICCLLLLSAMRIMSRQSKETTKANLDYQRSAQDALEARNDIGERQLSVLNNIVRAICRHRNVTVTEGVGFCNDCGKVVDFNRESKNWE